MMNAFVSQESSPNQSQPNPNFTRHLPCNLHACAFSLYPSMMIWCNAQPACPLMIHSPSFTLEMSAVFSLSTLVNNAFFYFISRHNTKKKQRNSTTQIYRRRKRQPHAFKESIQTSVCVCVWVSKYLFSSSNRVSSSTLSVDMYKVTLYTRTHMNVAG